MTKAAVVKFQNKYASEVLTPYGLTAGTGFFGTASRAKANAMIAAGVGTGTGTVTPATGSYTVSLAANQPSGTLGEGSAYNPVLKINVSAGTTAQSITSVTVQRTGLSIDSNVDGVLVADETGVRHGNIVSLANGTATITFTNSPIAVAAGTTKTISIQLNMKPDAAVAVNFSGTMGINLTAMSGTPAGLPLVGNTFTLVDTNATMGTLTTDVVTISAAAVNKDIGSTGYEIQKFEMAAGANEDINLKSLTIYQNGTAADTDIANIKLVAPDGTVLATVATPTNKYVTFDISAAPYKIAKGVTKNLAVKLDVVSGSSRTIQFIIQNDYDVVATGVSTGLNVIPVADTASGVDKSFPMGDAANLNSVAIAAGSAYITKTTTSPSGVISVGSSNVTIATFNFEARGEDIEIRKVDVNIQGTGLVAADLAGTVKLVTEDGQTIFSASPTATGLVGAVAAGTNIDTMSTYYTIPAGTTKKISVVVDTASGLGTTDTIYAQISDIYYKKVTSNAYATYQAGTYIVGNELSASAGTLTVVKNGSLGSSTKVAGSTDVKIGSYLLQTNSTEGVNVSSIAILITGASAGDTDANFSNLRIKKADGTVLGTAVTAPVIDGSTANTFSVSGELNIPASTTTQVDVYVNMNTAAADGGAADTLVTSIAASGVSATGSTSGAPANGPTGVQTGQTIVIVTGGALTVSMETSGAASAQFLTTGLSGVELGKVKLAATVENMKIERLEVRSINGNGNIAQVKLLGSGQSSDPTAVVTNGTAVFTFPSGSEITVPAYGSRVLTVAVDTTNVGTMTAGKLGTVGFGTMNARGEGSGVAVEETVTGTAFVSGTDAFTGAVGDVIYFTKAAVDGTAGGVAANTAPGFYMVTTTTAGHLNIAAGSIKLNGEADLVSFTTGNKVVLLNKVGTDATIDDVSFALAVGDIVYIHDVTTPANDGFYAIDTAVVLNGSCEGADACINGLNLVSASDAITKFTNVNAIVANTMRFEEVEPVMTKNGSSPSGSVSSNSDQIVAMYDIKAEGSRDLTFDSFSVEKGGSNNPNRNVVAYSLYNGTTKLSDVATTNTASTGVLAATAAGTEIIWSDLGLANAAAASKIYVGDTLQYATTAAATTVVFTGKVTAKSATGLKFDTLTVVAAAGSFYNNRVHFDTSSTTGLVAQTITAGQTLTLTVKSDTTNVKSGLGAGVNATLTFSIPGASGPLTTDVGGLDWDYTPLGSGGAASYKTQADNYPVIANTLTY
jgi:hypothetical protein